MEDLNIERKLLYRELNGARSFGSRASLYGARKWIDNLDIVAELSGHEGCVNALCWSRDGELLATGSDDTMINIHSTSPEWTLNAQIDTGHIGNIFSVKFMPHSADRTVVSAAGDGEVRIFDIEYAPVVYGDGGISRSARGSSRSAGLVLGQRFVMGHRMVVQSDVIPLKAFSHQVDTHKVYRSHTDRVKRIVTEASPHTFLTCSEDGTVRQFDLRQPSAFYSPPEGSAQRRFRPGHASFFGLPLPVRDEDEEDHNPPLISYKKHYLPLNTISCSTSQPHYIALGGGHLHCFLHDRRMVGRDVMKEAGKAAGDRELDAATKCVRRFAPRPNRHGKYRGHCHITACKISNSYPDEVAVSWSSDGVYLFDLKRSPEPNEEGEGREPWDPSPRRNQLRENALMGRHKAPRSKRRMESEEPDLEEENLVPGSNLLRIKSLLTEIRERLMMSWLEEDFAEGELPLAKQGAMDEMLAIAITTLKRVNKGIEKLDEADKHYFETHMAEENSEFRRRRGVKQTLAGHRRTTRSFVRAAGCLARALGATSRHDISPFSSIRIELEEGATTRYTILQLIVCFLDGGVDGVRNFLASLCPEGGEQSQFVESYLDNLASTAEGCGPVSDAEGHVIFSDESEMVVNFRDIVLHELGTPDEERQAREFWGERVGRALLIKEGGIIGFDYVNTAFGDIHGDTDSDFEYEEIDATGWMSSDEEEDDEKGEEDWSGEDDNDSSDVNEDYTDEIDSTPSPIYEHVKAYRGHCNVKTIKDVNFYGLNDEYVVSGSDCGNLFIWDKKTTKLLNILHGDDEVVNVITGHPVIPQLAVAGMDATVKIFSPDATAQVGFPGKTRQMMHNSYAITSQNEVSNESGIHEATYSVLPQLGLALRFL